MATDPGKDLTRRMAGVHGEDQLSNIDSMKMRSVLVDPKLPHKKLFGQPRWDR